MARVKRGVTSHARHKKVLEKAKGYFGRRKNTIKVARQAVEKAGQYAYRDRRVRKRDFRRLWIQRINAAARANGTSYALLIGGLAKANIEIDRKMLSDLAIQSPQEFTALVKQIQSHIDSVDPKKIPIATKTPKKALAS